MGVADTADRCNTSGWIRCSPWRSAATGFTRGHSYAVADSGFLGLNNSFLEDLQGF